VVQTVEGQLELGVVPLGVPARVAHPVALSVVDPPVQEGLGQGLCRRVCSAEPGAGGVAITVIDGCWIDLVGIDGAADRAWRCRLGRCDSGHVDLKLYTARERWHGKK